MRHVKRWVWSAIAVASGLVILFVLFVSAVPLRSETLRRRIITTLEARLNSNVTLDDLSLRVFPRLHAEGSRLLIRDRRRPDVPPLISVEKFEVDADAFGVWRKRVAHVRLSGLVIAIPPDDDDDDDDKNDHRGTHTLHDNRGTATSGSADARATTQTGDAKPKTDPVALEDGVVIDTLDSDDAKLIIIPSKPHKKPKTWAIHKLRMHDVGAATSMRYKAALTNGVPPGEIGTEGHFGPWNRDEPGRTPLDGTFTFDRADLSVFEGIAGTLSARGSFAGSLNWIEVHGETDTPDFVVEVGGHPFALHAKYHTIVDGMNGDTRLERIDANFLQSTVEAKGAVLDGPEGEHGRTVTLDVTMPRARIEDVMTMAVKARKPPMTGALQLTTKFLLPPGHMDVVERLQLNGRFSIQRARFTDPSVQAKIVELSQRGRGRKTEATNEQVASDFQGRFALGNTRLKLSELRFAVPGAQVQLAGVYGLKSEALDFKGQLAIDAKVSQTVSGFKSLLLKIADPLFSRKGGGSVVPIRINGTRNDPKFGLDVGRVFNRGDDF